MSTPKDVVVEVEIGSTGFGYYYAVWVPQTSRKPQFSTDSNSERKFGYAFTLWGAKNAAKRAAKRIRYSSSAWKISYTI